MRASFFGVGGGYYRNFTVPLFDDYGVDIVTLPAFLF